jgi:hypothetical protein
MIGFDLVCGVAADKMEDGEGTARVCREPFVGDSDEISVEDEEMLALEYADGDGLARDHRGLAERGMPRGV